MNKQITETFVPVAVGGTHNVSILSDVGVVIIRPATSIILSASVNIATGGLTPRLNQRIVFEYAGNITSNTGAGYAVNILGHSLTNAQAAKEAMIVALYDGSAWELKIYPSSEGDQNVNGAELVDGSVPTDALADDAVTTAKLANIAQGSVLVGGASDAPTALDASGNAKVLVGDGTDVASVSISGDVTMSNTGVVTIGAGKITDAMLANSPATYYEHTVTITTAQLLDLYVGAGGTAIELIAAQGANTLIDVVSVKSLLDYNSATYAAGGVLQLDYDGNAGTAIASIAATGVTGSADTVGIWDIPTGVDTTGINAAVYLNNLTAMFTTGDSPLKLSILYRIIDFS
jgi:hypothetical protein